jgi:hypothetical protein
MEMAVKMMKGAARGAGRRWRGELLPCRRHHGGAQPLSPLPSWLWKPSPMEMGSMGETKMWFLAAAIRGWRSLPRIRFPPFI